MEDLWRRPNQSNGGSFHDSDTTRYTAEDFRFTTKSNVLYAIGLDWPTNGEAVIHALSSTVGTKHVQSVTLLGSDAKLQLDQRPDGLHIWVPDRLGPNTLPTSNNVRRLLGQGWILASIKPARDRKGRIMPWQVCANHTDNYG